MNIDKPEVTRTVASRKKDFLKALTCTLGIITPAAKKALVSKDWVYRHLKKDPKFKKQVEDIIEIQKDFAESKLLSLINDKNPASVIFYCKTRMKDRGYSDQQQIDLNINKDFNFNIRGMNDEASES